MLPCTPLAPVAPAPVAPTLKAKGDIEDDEDVPFTNSKPIAKKAPAPVVDDDEDDPDLAEFRKLLDD